ncbi:MAG: GntR family transcriptional regulator, partial [Rhizobium sp.]
MVSIYQRIFTDIETKIISGDWRPGDRIPVEHELA